MEGTAMKMITAFTAFVFFVVLFVLVLRNPKSTNAVIAAGVGTATGVAAALTGPSKT
jgi:hypothetical protein